MGTITKWSIKWDLFTLDKSGGSRRIDKVLKTSSVTHWNIFNSTSFLCQPVDWIFCLRSNSTMLWSRVENCPRAKKTSIYTKQDWNDAGLNAGLKNQNLTWGSPGFALGWVQLGLKGSGLKRLLCVQSDENSSTVNFFTDLCLLQIFHAQ